MRMLPVLAGMAGAVLLSLAVALTAWGYGADGLFSALELLFGHTYPPTKLAYSLLAFQVVAAFVLGVKGLAGAGRHKNSRPLLGVLSFAAPGFGLAATLIGVFLILRATAGIYFSDLHVVAPSFAEALTPVGFGLLVGAIAAAFKAAMASRITR